jgi:hypothetical protein
MSTIELLISKHNKARKILKEIQEGTYEPNEKIKYFQHYGTIYYASKKWSKQYGIPISRIAIN